MVDFFFSFLGVAKVCMYSMLVRYDALIEFLLSMSVVLLIDS